MLLRKVQIRLGFTLIELVAVVAILSIIALVAVSRVEKLAKNAKIAAAERDLLTIRNAFVSPESGYLHDMGGLPGFSRGYLRLANLMISTNLYGSVADNRTYSSGFRVDDPNRPDGIAGCAAPAAFTQWDAEGGRGWRGPYVNSWTGEFPSESDVRHPEDTTFGSRGFFPPIAGLREPEDILRGEGGCSIYGFPGEPAVIDPWGNPYVLQIPPAQAFPGSNTNLSDDVRFRYARVVSAGPDGRLQTPCFALNMTNRWETAWTVDFQRLSRQAGRIGSDVAARGDDIVLFVLRNDIDEGEDFR
ncbi:MAG: type II secretion system protein [Kiritimatiellae bacterium]|nr:type II secretion system protein [Kiritimatiellia bacterium]